MVEWSRIRWLSEFIVVVGMGSIQAAEFHVTPNGSPKGNGLVAEPWDLSTALVATEIVKPGDTVWIHSGTYRGGFVSR